MFFKTAWVGWTGVAPRAHLLLGRGRVGLGGVAFVFFFLFFFKEFLKKKKKKARQKPHLKDLYLDKKSFFLQLSCLYK